MTGGTQLCSLAGGTQLCSSAGGKLCMRKGEINPALLFGRRSRIKRYNYPALLFGRRYNISNGNTNIIIATSQLINGEWNKTDRKTAYITGTLCEKPRVQLSSKTDSNAGTPIRSVPHPYLGPTWLIPQLSLDFIESLKISTMKNIL